MWFLSRMIGLLFLLWLSWEDFKIRSVSERIVLLGGCLAMLYQWIVKDQKLESVLGGMLIGGIALFISFITRETMGYGDSMVILMLGIFLGMEELLEVLFWTFGAALVVAIFLLVKQRFGRKTAFPFIPVLTFGYVITCVSLYWRK